MDIIERIKQRLENSEEFIKQNIKIERNKKIMDTCGNEREFDLYWEYKLAGITYKTIIECKDYNSTISIEKVDALVGKMLDFPGIRPIPVFATNKGYQTTEAKKQAQRHRIQLLFINDLEPATNIVKIIKMNERLLNTTDE